MFFFNNSKIYKKLLFIFVFLLPIALQAQTDYSGTYFIGSRGYYSATPTNNFYLCPTEGWYFYQATNNYTESDTAMPFLTTYKINNHAGYDISKAVWVLEKHPTETDCYYIKQKKTGKYIVSNGQISGSTNANRMRVHLEAVADSAALAALGDLALFEITPHLSHLDIVPHSPNGRNGDNIYLVVNNNNQDQLNAQNSKTDGPNGNYGRGTGGIIGLYLHEDNAMFFLESVKPNAPVITDNSNGTATITAATGTTVYYTTDGTTPTTSSTQLSPPNNITLANDVDVIKAIAVRTIGSFNYSSDVSECHIPLCSQPEIIVAGDNVTITCATPGASIFYTVDGSPASPSSTPYSGTFSLGSTTTIKAVAFKTGYCVSDMSIYTNITTTVHSSSEITDMYGAYVLADDFVSTAAIGTEIGPFHGTIDGQQIVLSGLTHSLVAYARGATIKNVFVDNVNISGGTNVGAICNEATGSTRIYNCGVLATSSTVGKDDNGYDVITSCSSTISGSGYVGGIVGLLDNASRVINCFSYANITGGSYVGGIVGYNTVPTTATNLQTMVMNCMFYGDITGGDSRAPIYNGSIITNVGENTGVGNYNYFRLEAPFIQDNNVTKIYNCALGAETRFLQRFEFYRHLLNSQRELAAWWATGSASNKDQMLKWVLEPSQIGSATPYPILKSADYYPSVVNIDAENAVENQPRNNGGKLGTLAVTIRMGAGGAVYAAPAGAAITTSSLTLNITDKDPDHFNFNYYKVQLPYYNDVGTNNYTGNRIVTGWKIVSITGGTTGSFTTGEDAPAYNFADRNCTNKDLYGEGGSNRVFNQGAYWDVPEGVTAITIEPYWGKSVYLADANRDVVYNDEMTTAYPVANVGGGQIYTNGVSTFNDQIVYTSIRAATASTVLFSDYTEAVRKTQTVYDYAVVLVGNYHHSNDTIEASQGKPYTVTSVDLDGDNEPDYSFVLRFNNRKAFHPMRCDFLNLIGLGMAQKSTGGTGSYNFGIMQPKFWFEVTNTAIFRVTQFEYDRSDRIAAPHILQGGVIEQWVSGQSNGVSNKTTYFLVGGNVWFKEFHRGTHQDTNYKTKHPPVSVTGGDYNEFYLTGLYRGDIANYADNAECYINGGRFGTVCGAAMEGIGNADGANNTGNITWQVQNADIDEFYGGGINAAHPVEGNISTTIVGGYIRQFCGGPKFGDMSTGKTVTTTATGCIFGTFFGAGYGGNSYSRQAPRNHNEVVNFPHNDKQAGNHSSWNVWLAAYYTQSYSSTYGGVSTQFSYQFIPMSNNKTNVARIFVNYVKFSLATCHNVTSTLTGCTILNEFYGGGSLGKVDGPATSTLNGCTVNGNVYGAGFSASLPTVEVDTIGFEMEPYYYTELGTYRTGVKGPTTTYRWEHGSSIDIDKINHILYTTEDLTTLGQVMGDVTLTINGNSHIEGDVYGGGALSNTNTDANNTTTVNILDGTYDGNIYGGGQGRLADVDNNIEAVAAKVNGVVTVNIGADDGAGNFSGNANLTASSVYGCNNTNGSPQADVFVNVYKTARTEGTNTVTDNGYAIYQVFGGGNAANYAPENGNAASTKKATVHIYTCDNTIRRVFGGGNAASSQGVAVEIDGGRFYWAFGGGNGESGIAANIGNGGVDITVNGGKFEHIFSGCNEYGTIAGPTTATLTNSSGCTEEIKEYFGGNNLMPATSDITTTVSCDNEHPVRIIDLYGGSNLASITGNVTLNVEGGIIDNVFGGSKGTMETNAFITGNVELNLYGGTIGNAYGGSNINGSINGTITVNVYENSPCPLIITNVYGGGKNAAYTPTYTVGASEKRITPMVNILKGTVRNDVFGGGYGSGATVTANPKVTSGTKVEGVPYHCTIVGNVFGGGSMAEVNGDTEVLIINKTIVRGNIYGGGNEATVDGNTKVVVNGTTTP